MAYVKKYATAVANYFLKKFLNFTCVDMHFVTLFIVELLNKHSNNKFGIQINTKQYTDH